MELTKGSIITQTRSNSNPIFANTTANRTLVYKIVKVNRKTYELECIEGYMKGSHCRMVKNFKNTYTDEYGTVTTISVN